VRWTPLLALVALAGCTGSVEPPPEDDAEPVRAAGTGDVSAVRNLIAGGADVNARDASGRTAITAAVYGDHLHVVRALVDAGADPDLQDEMKANALLATGETGNAEILREVLRAEPDLSRTNRFGGTALIPAAHRGHVEVVRELLRTAIDIDHVNEPGWTALLEAVILGDGGPAHREIVGLLVAAGADVNLPDPAGVTPLEHARSRGFAEIGRELEAAGAH
jgi:ankyrin repeat protein